MRCPQCGSRDPKLHPATQSGGEVVHICLDEFHGPPILPTPKGCWGHDAYPKVPDA